IPFGYRLGTEERISRPRRIRAVHRRRSKSLQETLASIAKSGLPLQGKLDALKAEFETNIAPAPLVEALHRATDEMIASGAPGKALKAGDVAPAFTLPDADGNPVSSRDLLAKGPLVVTFYRGVWCPYCNLELQALQATLPEIAARGASLVAISPQTAANSRKSQRDNKLSFPILIDRGGEIAGAFSIRWNVQEYLKEV